MPPLVKVTLYRVLNSMLIFSFGVSKAVLAYRGESVAPTTLEWIMGVVLTLGLYWLGQCETTDPPVWPWFFHHDYSEPVALVVRASISEMLQCFLFADSSGNMGANNIPMGPINESSTASLVDVPEIIQTSVASRNFGVFTEIYEGEGASSAHDTRPVAVKRVRLHPKTVDTIPHILSLLTHIDGVSSSLRHPNICPIWLVETATPVPETAIAMPWFNNGNVLDHICQNPGIDRMSIVMQVASALAHVHAKHEVHGNIKPTNVMIADDGTARLSDIGVNSLLFKAIHCDQWPVPLGWMYKAPEELFFQGALSSFKSTEAMDVYSFAGTIYTIFASVPPFSGLHFSRAITEIGTGGHTKKTAEISDDLWKILRECWSYNPKERPSMPRVLSVLATLNI